MNDDSSNNVQVAKKYKGSISNDVELNDNHVAPAQTLFTTHNILPFLP